MSDAAHALTVLHPILDVIRHVDPNDPGATDHLNTVLPLDDPRMIAAFDLVRDGIESGWIVPREAGGVRFGRLAKPSGDLHGFSIDAVDMDGAGPGHTHPNGEIDLCFALEGTPAFDGHAPGWLVLPPGSWHVPTVSGGRMGILYFLPDGAIEFGPRSA